MAAKRSQGKRHAIDRWGTLRRFVEESQRRLNEQTGSLSASAVWITLFTLADGRTGLVRGASISRLAGLAGMARKTVQHALASLLTADAIAIHEKRGSVPVYLIRHLEKSD